VPSTDIITVSGTEAPFGQVPQLSVTNTCSQTCSNILTACIDVTKNCTPLLQLPGQPWTVSGVVSNCGNITLTNIIVTDNVFGAITNFGVLSLAPNATLSYSRTFTADCVGNTNTVTVTARSTCGVAVTDTATAACTVSFNSCIDITKTCEPTEVPGGTVSFSGIVTNCGNITLTNVIVVDRVPGVTTNTVLGPVSIAPLTSASYSGTYTVPANFCGRLTNTVTVTANDACGRVVGPDTAFCITDIPCPPDICVTKEVACAPVTDNLPANCVGLAYAKSATGIFGPTNQTAFCYRIVVHNCGVAVLTNVMVIDTNLAGGSGVLVGFPTTLNVGQRVTNYFSKNDWGVGTHTNTVTASGNSQATGQFTNKTDTAVARLLPISVECRITLSSTVNQTTNGPCVTLPDSGPVAFTLTITNTGQADLDVNVSGLPVLFDCLNPTNGIAVRLPIRIAVGGSSIIGPYCFDAFCPTGANLTVTVQGTAVASTNVPCIYDSGGNAVTTATSECTACVRCEQAVTCRVTGGGELNFDVVDESCIPVRTTLFPTSGPGGLELDHISHGGQLGAPFSQMDCGAILGNPCIRGEWQHTRHYKGPGNKKDVVDMSAHSANPKGVFDSLSCACLGCCDPESGAFIPATVGPLIHKFQLCNPDDHKICGPQPRPSPANAIIFSGIAVLSGVDGTNAPGNVPSNKNGEYVVFRVYIEDRSEPGGHFPKGATEPSDIYCFQAWRTGIAIAKKPNFNTVATAFRTALGEANCEFLNALSTGALPIGSLPPPLVLGVAADINDCGPLDRGNHQIHPSTGATCDVVQ
jgi:uncharacterized repeat protein (TIGR01451 family)